MRDDRYTRQSLQITGKTHDAKVAIIGVGGVGSWIGQQLALLGVDTMYLFDMDIVDIHNLNRSVFRESDVGKAKVSVFGAFCEELNPAVKVLSSNIKITSVRELPDDVDVVFSAVDNVETRLILQDWAKRTGKLVIDCGTSNSTTEGTVCELMRNLTPTFRSLYGGDEWDEQLTYEKETPPCQRRPEPAIVTLTSAVATLAVHLFIQYRTTNHIYSGLFQFNWGKTPILSFFESKPDQWN